MKAARSFRKKRYIIKKDFKYLRVLPLIAAFLICPAWQLYSEPQSRSSAEAGYVTRVIDGDTLELSDGRRIRLIGIDTPESYFSEKLLREAKRAKRDMDAIIGFGRKASRFTKDLCFNKKVRLDFDVQRKDKYARTLAYVYLDDGTFVNARIIEEGFGKTLTIPPNVKHAGYFLKLEKEARSNNKGLWEKGGL